jgi:hypothetical protein
MVTNEVILGKAQISHVPVISVRDDTFPTVEKIESVLGKIRIREQKKVVKSKGIMEKEFYLDSFFERSQGGEVALGILHLGSGAMRPFLPLAAGPCFTGPFSPILSVKTHARSS